MSESATLEGTRRTPTPHASLGLLSLVVLAVVMVTPVQLGATLVTPWSHASAAPTAASVVAPVVHHGITIAPSVLSSPLGHSERSLLNAITQRGGSGSLASLGPLLGAILPQTQAPARVAAPHPDYTGGVNNVIGSSDCQGWGVIQSPNGYVFVPTIAGSSIAQVGGSNQTLVASGGSMISLFNVSGGVLCTSGIVGPATLNAGYSNGFWSSNGGASWTNVTIPQNLTHWHSSTDVANGSMTTGNDVVAAAPNGLTLLMSGYAQACIAVPVTLTCTSSQGLAAPWGYGVARSTDGGHTYSALAQVSSDYAFVYITFPTACNVNPNPALEPLDIPEHPSIATDGTNAVATWDIFHYIWDPANCTIAGLQATVQSSHSTDGGLTWSAVTNVSGPVSQSPTVRWGSGSTVYDVFTDVSSANASNTGQLQHQWSKSTDGGATWGSLALIGSHNVDPTCVTCAAAPDAINTPQYPAFAVDNWTGSPYSGNLYVAWQDNGTGSVTGQVVIAFERSISGGSVWQTSKYLTVASGGIHYLEPAITVTPDGKLWVTFYGFSTNTGYYNLYGVVSTDGGVTFSPPFLISSAASTPSQSLQDIGFYMGGAGTSAGLVPIWSDCRQASCTTSDDVQLYTANVNVLNISSNAVSPITAQVTEFGVGTSMTLPVNLGVDTGASVTVKVPVDIPYNATYVDAFTGWVGLSTSANFQTTVTFPGAGTLTAMYTPVPAAFIQGTFAPNGAGAALTLNGVPVTLSPFNSTAYQYTVSVPSGQVYYLNASEPKYVSDNRLVPVSSAATTWENFSLQRATGFLTGTLTPAASYLYLNGTNVTAQVGGNGQFNLVVPWGWYWLNASKPGFTSSTCQGHEVQVNPNVATTCNFNLVGGWIFGTVIPAKPGLVVRIDNVVVTTSFGVFNQSVPGGYHTLMATQPGYNLSVISAIAVTPGRATPVNVSLTNQGWITGVIGPTTALKNLLLTITNGTQGGPKVYDATTGAYNVSVPGGYGWKVTVTSPGYNASTQTVFVTAGNVSLLDFTLGKASSGGCTSNCNNPPPGNNSTTPASNGIPLTWVLVIVVVIVLVAVVAMVMMMRRRPGGGSTAPPPPPEETYQGTNPSELPKLQSDGSMSENPPEQ